MNKISSELLRQYDKALDYKEKSKMRFDLAELLMAHVDKASDHKLKLVPTGSMIYQCCSAGGDIDFVAIPIEEMNINQLIESLNKVMVSSELLGSFDQHGTKWSIENTRHEQRTVIIFHKKITKFLFSSKFLK